MKHPFLIASTGLIFLLATAFTPLQGLEDVIRGLKAGNANELARYIDDNIELSLPEKADTYSRSQAVMILKDFFANNTVRGFDVKHKGDNAGNQFCIGTLYTASGNYRTTIFMTTKSGKQLIRQITFQST
jgi:hypothetical protein